MIFSMTFLFSKITGFACIRKDPTAALLCTARRTKGVSMECRQVRTCYDLAAATEESPTPSSRAKVEDCLSSLFSLWLAPSFLLGLFLYWSWLRLLHLLHRGNCGSLSFCYLLREACEAIIRDVQSQPLFEEEGEAHSLVCTCAIHLIRAVIACVNDPYIVCGLAGIGFSC